LVWKNNEETWGSLGVRLIEVLLEPTLDKGYRPVPGEFVHALLEKLDSNKDTIEDPARKTLTWLSDFYERETGEDQTL
jgi:hypothetical protein